MSHRILIAEDDPNTRGALREIIGLEGYEVVTAADGLAAKRQLESLTFDLLCLDVMMPTHSGFDLCRWVRQRDAVTPIIFITAKGDEIDKVVGFELGADDYICKPFGSHEVVARIRAVLRRCAPQTQPADTTGEATAASDPTSHASFPMGDLLIHPAKLRACRGNKEIRLTPRELHILILLHQADGDVVSRNALYQQAWEAESIPNSRTVDQTLSQLRKRIEVDAKHPRIIQTVYGIGYRYDTGVS